MARLLTLHLLIQTQQLTLDAGTPSPGTPVPVRIRINQFVVPLNRLKGDLEPGHTYEGSLDINSVVHSLELMGPPSGRWEIDSMTATFRMDNGSHVHEMVSISLDANQPTNIWVTEDTFAV